MTDDEILHIEGWTVDPKEVRKIATKMGIPDSTGLPEVIVVGEDHDEEFQGGPQIQRDVSGKSPSGFFITIPESMLKKVNKDTYVLGPNIREDLRHELAHFEDYLEGGHVGREEDPYKTALKEIQVELRIHPRSMSLCLARHAARLVEEYNLSVEDALRVMEDAARELGISSRIISKMYKLCEE